MKTTLHWISDGYTHLKNARGSYSFKTVNTSALEALAAEFEAQAQRKLRQAAMIAAYLNGETQASPEALTTR